MNELTPPGTTTMPIASDVLVVAPHHDDETLGCGGLLIRLARSGATVRVLFLTDGAAGARDAEERERIFQVRRDESKAALAILGLGDAGAVHLGLADGGLVDSISRVEEEVGKALAETPAALLLCPSPIEASQDHRAAFAAVHRLLAQPRASSHEDRGLDGVRVLLYEINHPAYPDVLVDVGNELEVLEEAVRCYASQLEEHDYLSAALGLRKYRTLSLGREVRAAEAFRELHRDDFRTRGLERLIADLGGAPSLVTVDEGPSITAIVRTKDRPELLAQALASIARSTYRRLDVLVVNDGGRPPELPSDFPFPIRRIDLEENQGRAAAAQAGLDQAGGVGVSFLDDDDLVEPEHYATLAGLLGSSGVRIGYTDAAVAVYETGPDGWTCVERRLPYSRDFDADRLLLDNYIPFHTLIFECELLRETAPFDESFSFFEDWEMLIRLAQKTAFHHLAAVTCEYRHFRGSAHHILGNDPRARGDFLAMKARIYGKHRDLLGPELLARAVDGLRSEAVDLAEAAAARLAERKNLEDLSEGRRIELQNLRNEFQTLRVRFDSQRGQLQSSKEYETSLREEIHRLGKELDRVYGEEKRLAELGQGQDGQIADLQGEVERQREVIQAMQSSRVWRWTEWWRRWRS